MLRVTMGLLTYLPTYSALCRTHHYHTHHGVHHSLWFEWWDGGGRSGVVATRSRVPPVGAPAVPSASLASPQPERTSCHKQAWNGSWWLWQWVIAHTP